MVARIKREDLVEVIRGRDKGKRGTVQQVMPLDGKALVEGLNMVKKHMKAGATTARQAGIIDMEKPIAIFKIMPVCPSCDRPTRVGVRVLEDGSKARVCKRCDGMLV
jgi:large subunit ribosomal protein L24